MKSAFRGDVCQGESSRFHETNRPLNAEPQYELVRRNADGAAEETGKVEGADVCLTRERNQRDIFTEVCIDEAHDAAKLKGVQLATRRRHLRLRNAVIREQ